MREQSQSWSPLKQNGSITNERWLAVKKSGITKAGLLAEPSEKKESDDTRSVCATLARKERCNVERSVTSERGGR